MKNLIRIFAVLLFASVITNAQGKLSLGFNGGLASPGGDFGDIYKSGFGGNGVLTFNLTGNILLSGSIGYYTMDIDNDKIREKAGSAGNNLSIEAPMTIIPIMVGAKYLFSPLIVKPYVSVELGLHSISIDEVSVTSNGQKTVFVTEASQSETAWAIGAGAYISVAPKIEIEVSVKYNGNGSEAGTSTTTTSGNTVTTESSSSSLTFLTVLAGINFAL